MEIITRIFPETTLHALGWTVLHSLWQGFAIALLLTAFLLAYQKKNARIRYLAGNAALLLLLVSAVVTFFLCLWQNEERLASVIVSEQGEVLGRYFHEAEERPWLNYFNEHLPLIVTVWVAGMAFFFLKMLGGLLYIQRLRHYHVAPLGKDWQEMLGTLSAELRLTPAVQLMESALVRTPMVIGWLKPLILLPVGAVNHLSTAQVEAILAHELAHIARHDYLLNLLQSVIEALFYFNPAVWFISTRIRTERENCCDDIAVQLCGNSLTYAKALVALQEMQMAAPDFAMAFAKKRSHLLARIQRILQPNQHNSNVMEKLSATLLLTLAVVMLSVQANTPFGNFIQRIVSPEIVEAAAAEELYSEDEIPAPALAPADTIPARKGDSKRNGHLTYSNDGDEFEVTWKDGEITEMISNGEVIPKEDYDKFEGKIAEIGGIEPPEMPEMPEMPELTEFPEMPEMPEMPEFENFGTTHPAFPALAPMPEGWRGGGKNKTITTTKDGKNSTTFIIESGDGRDPVIIETKKGKKGAVTINGNKIKGLKKGDQTIIIQKEGQEVPYLFHLGELAEMEALSIPDVSLMEPGAYALIHPGADGLFNLSEDAIRLPAMDAAAWEKWQAESQAWAHEWEAAAAGREDWARAWTDQAAALHEFKEMKELHQQLAEIAEERARMGDKLTRERTQELEKAWKEQQIALEKLQQDHKRMTEDMMKKREMELKKASGKRRSTAQ